MYVIQTNRTNTDFQSLILRVDDLNWEEFKEYILSDNYDKEIIGTMQGKLKLKDCKYEIFRGINDDYHFKVTVARPDNLIFVADYYLVADDDFKNLIN